MPFPSDPAGQTPANTFSPTSTPDANTLNNATYTFNATDNQWSTRDPVPPQPAPPPAGTEIEQPTITAPADGTTGIDPDTSVTITSSAYDGTNAGDHASTSWQVTEGVQPRVSTNLVTDSLDTPALYTTEATWLSPKTPGNGEEEERMRTIQNVVRTEAGNGIPSRLWGVVWNGAGPSKQSDCTIFFSDDNGSTWTDDTTRFQAANGGHSWSPGGYGPKGVFSSRSRGGLGPLLLHADGLGWTMWMDGNCLNPSSQITGGVRYRIDTDSYTDLGTTGCGVNSGYSSSAWGGQIVNVDGTPSNSWVQGDYQTTFGKFVVPDISTISSMPAGSNTSNLSTLGQFANNTEIYFGRGGNGLNSDLSSNAWFTCPISQDVTDPANRTELENEQANGENWGSYIHQIQWQPRHNQFVMLCVSGNIQTYTPSTNTFVLHRLSVTDDIEAYIDDGNTYWFITDKQRIITTTNMSDFFLNDNSVAVGQHSFPIYFDDVSGRYISTVQPESQLTVGIAVSTQPTDAVTLNIVGAQTDGFEIGDAIVNRGGVAASGIVQQLNDTSVIVRDVEGTWTAPASATPPEDPTQRIAIPTDEFNVVVDDRDDTTNLTSLELPANVLTPNAEYRARVQYRSDSNVVSNLSEWSSFSTSD